MLSSPAFTQRYASLRVISAFLCLCILHSAQGFIVSPTTSTALSITSTITSNLLTFATTEDDGEDAASNPSNDVGANQESARREQEIMMERYAIKGAKKIAQLDIPERAKRAMLAEAVEDQIFANTERLEFLVDQNGMVPEENHEEVMELAKQTKQFQTQYEELVSGEKSSILDTMMSATETSKGEE